MSTLHLESLSDNRAKLRYKHIERSREYFILLVSGYDYIAVTAINSKTGKKESHRFTYTELED